MYNILLQTKVVFYFMEVVNFCYMICVNDVIEKEYKGPHLGERHFQLVSRVYDKK